MLHILLVFLLVICYGRGDIDFEDCGSDHFDVTEVVIEGCSDSPCPMIAHKKQEITVFVENIGQLRTSEIQSEAFIVTRGIHWRIPFSPTELCSIWRCPLNSMRQRRIQGTVKLQDIHILGPAKLIIHLNNIDATGVSRRSVCMKTSILIEKSNEEDADEESRNNTVVKKEEEII